MTMQQPDQIENADELLAQLEAFASAHLEPDPAATERMRSLIMTEAGRVPTGDQILP